MHQLSQSDLASIAEDLELRGLSFDGLNLAGFDFADRVIEDCAAAYRG